MAVTLAAIVATAPLLALHFGRASLVGVPANLLIVPVFPFILLASLLAALGGLLPEGRLVLAAPAYALLTYWLEVTQWLASVPYASATVGGYSTRWAALTYGTVAVGGYALLRFMGPPPESRLAESRPLEMRRLRARLLVATPVVALMVSVGFVAWPSEPARLEMTVLDVGQGDAILVTTPDGDEILIDGGPGRAVLRALGTDLSYDDRSIELLLLTHPQADHMAGLIEVLSRYDVRRIIAGPTIGQSEVYGAFEAAARHEGRLIGAAHAGMTIDLGDGALLEVLWPTAGAQASASNNDSLVVRLSWGDVRFLLAGDIEAGAEGALIGAGADLETTVLKVAHHGSRTSTTPVFLERARPSVAVVSAGAETRFGHPAPDVVARLEQYGAVFTTAGNGDVRFSTDGRRLWIDTER